MALRKEDNNSSEMTPGYKFIRNSKLRQSVRIKNRLQLPPSALIYMKTLEKQAAKDPVNPATHQHLVIEPCTLRKSNKSYSMDFSESDELTSDDSPLIRRLNSKKSCKSKNLIVKKHKSLSTLFNFFR